jgi:FeS assembly SUF system protein
MDETGKQETAPAPETAPAAPASDTAGTGDLRQQVIETLCTIFDPEIPVNIYELGLVYEVEASTDGDITVTMTLTTPNCPVAGSMPGEVETRIGAMPGVRHVDVNLVWDPPWTPERMSEAAKLELGML